MATFGEYTKKKKKEQSVSGKSFTEYTSEKLDIDIDDIAPISTISPTVTTKPTVTTSDTKKSLFSDGYDFGDISRTILRSTGNKEQKQSSFDANMAKKYSTMSLSDLEKNLARIEKEEKEHKGKNGGKIVNTLSKVGSYLTEGQTGQSGSATRAKSQANIDKINDYTREKEILNTYRKQRATEEYLGGLNDKQLQLLDDIVKADDLEKAKPLVSAMQGDNADMAGIVYHQLTKGDMDASDDAFTTLSKQLKKKLPDKGNDEIYELINNMVELRKSQVNAEEKEKLETQSKELAAEHPVASFALSRASNLIGGIAALPELAFQWNNEYGLDTNAPGFLLTHTSKAIDEQVQLDHDWKIKIGDSDVDAFDLLYNVGTGVVDNVGRLVASGGNTTLAGAMMFTQGTTQSIIEGKEKGYSDSKALTLGLLSGTFEAISEKMSLDIILGSSGGALKTLAKSLLAEGTEEVTSNWLNRIAEQFANGKHSDLSKMYEAYKSEGLTDAQAMAEVVLNMVGEDVESFVVGGLSGALLGGGVSIANAIQNNTKNIELTENEQKVVDKVVEDRIIKEVENGEKVDSKKRNKIYDEVIKELEKGRISTDTIESILGGEEYEAYKKAKDSTDANITKGNEVIKNLKQTYDMLQKEYESLNELDLTKAKLGDYNRQSDLLKKQAEIRDRIKKTEAILVKLNNDTKVSDLKTKLGQNVFDLVKDSRLSESYKEIDRHKQVFSADVEQYESEYAKKTVQNAIDYRNDEGYGIDNTNASHDFIDLMTNYATDREVEIVFTTTKGLAELKKNGNKYGFNADPSETNAFVSKKYKKIFINMDTGKNLYSLVGHEVTHTVLNAKSLGKLTKVVKAYSGEAEYRKIYDKKAETYKDYNLTKAEIEEEIVADFCGERLLTDYDFVMHLATNEQNIFQKAWDSIKYLYKMATAGSKEARQLEKAKRIFEKAYRESAKSTDTETQYSLTEKGDFGYHAGDLGKAEGYWNMVSSNRGTGHFGTGTYFVGDEAQISDKTYGSRPHEKVDFSNYKLYKPLLESEGFELHDSLKYINNHISLQPIASMSFDEAYDVCKKVEDAEWTLYWDDNATETEKTEAQKILDEAKERFEAIGYDPENWDSDKLKEELNDIRSDYRMATMKLTHLFSYKKNNGFLSYEETEQQVNSILQNVYNETSKIEDAYNARYEDSPSTRFMKAMGYEGIDVRGHKGLDNTTYGSIIYDLKGDDLARKKEIGTAKYSLSSEQESFFKDSKVRDENGNLKVMYHGTSKGGHTVFDTFGESKFGLFGAGTYFTDNKDIAKSYTEKGRGNNKQVYESYLNITNPIDMDAQADVDAWKNAFPDADYSDCVTNEDCFKAMKEVFVDEQYPQWEAKDTALDVLQGMGYDGITHIGGGRVNADGTRHQVYIAFEPEQIKNIDNIAPTKDADIRYSLGDSIDKFWENNYNEDTHYGESLRDTPAYLKPSTDTEWQVFCRSFANKTSDIGSEERKITIFTADYQYLVRADGYMSGRIVSKVNVNLYNESGDFYDNYSRSNVSDSYDEGKGNRQRNNSNGIEPSENEGADSFYVELDKFIKNHPEYFSYIREINSADRRQIDLDNTDLFAEETSSEDGVFFDAEKTKFSLSEDSNGRELSTGQRDYFNRAKTTDENGRLKPFYHGTGRADRVGTVFDPNRATSGPMAFFTDNKEIADNYAKDKKDTSIAYDSDYDSYETQFRVNRNGKDMSVVELWNTLSMSERNAIKEKAKHITMDDDWENVIYSENAQYGLGNFDAYELNAHRGNALHTLVDSWLTDGNIYGEEHKFLDVLKLVGIEDAKYLNPDFRDEKTYEVYLNITNPFDTSDISDEMLDALKTAAENADFVEGNSADMWDKRNMSPERWIERLEDDIANGTTHSWTSIPDFVTDTLKAHGYDGIFDKGGKGGGVGHTVAIPFYSEQIKNVDNLNPTTNKDIRNSLSEEGETFGEYGNLKVYAKDIMTPADIAPVQQTVSKTEQVEGVGTVNEDDYAPMTEEQALRNAEADRDYINSFTDADMPPEFDAPIYSADTTSIDDKTLKNISAMGRDVLLLNAKERRMLEGIVQKYSTSEDQSNSTLFNEIKNVFGEKSYTERIEEVAEVRQALRGYKINVSPSIKRDIADYTQFMRRNFGKIIFSKEGMPVDTAYMELSATYPDFFPSDIVNPSDQLQQMSEVANLERETTNTFELDDDVIQEATDVIQEAVGSYKEKQMLKSTQRDSKAILRDELRRGKEEEKANAKAEKEAQKKTENVITAPIKGATEVMGRKDNTFRAFVRNFVSKGQVIETLALKTGNRAVEDKYKMWKDRSEAEAQYFMEEGNGSVNSLKSIVERANKSGLYNDFDRYLKHKHNVDRMQYDLPVFGYETTAEMSQQIADELESKHPEFKEWANETYAINNHLRQKMVDAGIITQETADLWAKKYPHYVPIERLSDDNIKQSGKGIGVSAPIKRATGGSSETESILKAMAHRTEQVFKAVNKNAFALELRNTIGTVAEVAEANTDDFLDGLSTMDEGLLQAGTSENVPTFTAFENGKRVTFGISEEMYEALKPTSNEMLKEHKIASKPTSWHKKVLTEYNLFFTARNFPKDAQEVIFNSHHAAKTYANMPVAVKELLKGKGEYITEYWEHGGKSNTYFDRKTNEFESKGPVKKVLGFIPEQISKVNDFVEAIPRLAEYIASRKQGATIEAAMTDAARVTTDFSDGGDVTKFLNRNGVTFLNASVQGVSQQARNIRQAKAEGFKGVVKLTAKYAAAGLPVLLFNQLMWDDDEEYEELSEYVKDNYYIVAKYGDGQFVRIPKGRTASVIQEFFEQFGNMITGKETDWKNVATMFASNLAPNNPIDNNIIAPIIQAQTNTTWYGEDLVPSRLQDLPNEEQYDESIDTISKWLGEKFNGSPYRINYVLNQYSGFIGDIVLPNFTPEAERGDSSALGNIIAPLKDQFVVDRVIDNKNPSDFFSLSDELKVNANSSKATDEDKLKYKYINSVNGDISDLYKEKREIQNSNLSDDLKFKQVRDIQEQINEMSKNALDTYENVKVDGKYANIGDRHFRLNDENEWQKITDEQLEKQNEAIGILGITPGQYWSNKQEYDMAAFYPEKYAVLQQEGISVKEYKEKYEETAFMYTDDFSWAANNPEKYTFSKAITDDVMSYREITSGLYAIRADKDSNGKTINGSAKKKKKAYIWSLDIDDGAKYILFKNEYNSVDDYNDEIVDYLNSRDDITYDEMNTILEQLGAKVDDEGYISW